MINNLSEVYSGILGLGYLAELTKNAVVLNIGNFPTVITINNKKELIISCQIATLGMISEEKLTEFSFAALNANTQLSPFAIALIIEDGDNKNNSNEETDYPITLIDSVPIGDLCQEEIKKSLESLHSAIVSCEDVLKIGMGTVLAEV